MTKRMVFAILIIGSILFITACGTENATEPGEESYASLKIGALVPMNGEGSIDGEANIAAIELAIEDVNKYLKDNNKFAKVKAVIKETKGNYVTLKEKIEEFADEKTNMLVSVDVSENIYPLGEILTDNDMLMINTSATSNMISKEDNIIRYVPNDNYSAKVLARVLHRKGVERIVVLYRLDVWGKNLAEALEDEYKYVGGKSADLVGYDARLIGSDFNEVVNQLDNFVLNATNASGTEKTAVVVFAYDEIKDLLKMASAKEVLDDVKWYGGDGLAFNKALLFDISAAEFAYKVGMYSIAIGEPESQEVTKLKARITQKIGHEPYSEALTMYDAVWTASETLVKAGKASSADKKKSTLTEVLSDYNGVTGKIELDVNGDRKSCTYNFWGIVKGDTEYLWFKAFSANE